VQVFDFSKLDDEYFFAMEYVKGIDLRQALKLCRSGGMRWPPALCMRVISDVCAGLDAAHNYKNEQKVAVPIIHRDISPENVIISLDGAVKVTDFGIAKAADSTEKTASGVFKGKHAYSAPEQMEDVATADQRTDIYAAAIVMFELLSLRRYLGDEPTLSMAYAMAHRPPVKLSAEREDIPEALQPIFEKASHPDRTLRYQSAREFRDDLEQLMKKGDYPTSDDLASFIRKVIALRGSTSSAVIDLPPDDQPRTTTGEEGLPEPEPGDALKTTRGHTLSAQHKTKGNADGE
jgi:serine/threonine-protein kinase